MNSSYYLESILDSNNKNQPIVFWSDPGSSEELINDSVACSMKFIGMLTGALIIIIRGSSELNMNEVQLIRDSIKMIETDEIDISGLYNHIRIEVSETGDGGHSLNILKKQNLLKQKTPQEITDLDLKHICRGINMWKGTLIEFDMLPKEEIMKFINTILETGFAMANMEIISNFDEKTAPIVQRIHPEEEAKQYNKHNLN